MTEHLEAPNAFDGHRHTVQIGVKLLRPGARLPARAYSGDAAYDLFSADELCVAPQARAVIGTGIALDLPPGMAALTLPRSGLAARHGISLVNTPGLIDPGYRGEVKLIVLNTDSAEEFTVTVGDRLAQLLLITLSQVELHEIGELSSTHRGTRGFGSSGKA